MYGTALFALQRHLVTPRAKFVVTPKINKAERAAKESDAGVSPEPHFFA